jgi:hypothetical protein
MRGDIPVTNDMFMLRFKGKDNGNKIRLHLTPRGQLVAAIRRNLTNAAAKDFGTSALCDMSASSMIRSEIILGACRIASFSKFHEQLEADIKESSVPFAVATHAYSNEISL